MTDRILDEDGRSIILTEDGHALAADDGAAHVDIPDSGTDGRATGYCTQADIIKAITQEKLIQLTDDDNMNVVNAEHVTQAIATADSEIDGYCGSHYAVPFSAVPPIIRGLSVEIAVYYLHKRRTVPEKVERAYDKAILRLKDIARGLLSLGIEPPPPAASSSGVKANKAPSDRIFTRNTMSGF